MGRDANLSAEAPRIAEGARSGELLGSRELKSISRRSSSARSLRLCVSKVFPDPVKRGGAENRRGCAVGDSVGIQGF